LAIVDQPAQILRAEPLNGAREHLYRPDRADRLRRLAPGGTVAATAECNLALGIGELPLELAALLDDLLHTLDHVIGFCPQQACKLAHPCFLTDEIVPGAIAGEGFEAPNACSARALGNDVNEPDIARAGHMRAAAELNRPSLVRSRLRQAHGDDTHFIAVLFAEK